MVCGHAGGAEGVNYESTAVLGALRAVDVACLAAFLAIEAAAKGLPIRHSVAELSNSPRLLQIW